MNRGRLSDPDVDRPVRFGMNAETRLGGPWKPRPRYSAGETWREPEGRSVIPLWTLIALANG